MLVKLENIKKHPNFLSIECNEYLQNKNQIHLNQ